MSGLSKKRFALESHDEMVAFAIRIVVPPSWVHAL